MQSSLEREVRQQLARYASGEILLAEFQTWFVPNTWTVERDADPKASQLVYRIELLLAEYSSGHWTESELRTKLRTYVGSSVIVVDFAPSAWIQPITTLPAGYQPEDATRYFLPSPRFEAAG